MYFDFFTRSSLLRRVSPVLVAPIFLCLAGCPMEDDEADAQSATGGSAGAPNNQGGQAAGGGGAGGGGAGGAAVSPTHSALLSIQDMSFHGQPQLGHGLTIQVLFAPIRKPVFEEIPDSPLGCRAWSYEVDRDGVPVPADEGVVSIAGLTSDPIECRFEPGRGYICPVATASGSATVTPSAQGHATVTVAGATFSEEHVGMYLALSGSASPALNGAFPIVARPDPESVVIVLSGAVATSFEAELTVMAGAGPIPGLEHDPIAAGQPVDVSLAPGGETNFAFMPETVAAGAPFALDAATHAVIGAIPLDGGAIELGCAGEGGECGESAATIVRITATDGDTEGLSPFAMPPAISRQVEIQCADLTDAGSIVVPAGAMAVLAEANRVSPIRRIRTAFMREGLSLTASSPPLPPNPAVVLVGHGVLAYTNP